MAMVAYSTQKYLAGVFQNEMKRSLAISDKGYDRAIGNLCEDQMAKALMQSQRTVLTFSTSEHFNSVLNYYLRLAQADLNVDCLEILDAQGNLLADGSRYYKLERNLVPAPLKTIGQGASFFIKDGPDLFLLTAAPLEYMDKRVGYVCIGKRMQSAYLTSLASLLHSEIVFFVRDRYTVGTLRGLKLPPGTFPLKTVGGRSIFLSGVTAGTESYDFVIKRMQTTSTLGIYVGIGLDRRGMSAMLARSRLFLILLSLAGFALSWVGSYLLARNIKRSIFRMEPGEIAAVLNERTAILQSTFEGIIAVDRTGIITLINQNVQKLLPEGIEALGLKITDLIHDPNLASMLRAGEALYNQQHLLGETIIFYNMVPIKRQNGIIGAVITLRDLTEFQKVAAELMEIKSYTQALRAQSHEFINKLHTVSGLIQLGRYEQALSQLLETVQSHQELVTFLIRAFPSSSISGILLGKFNLANELNIKFHLNQDSGLRTVAKLPETELVCVIGNLIENALEALKASDQTEKNVWVKIKERRSHLSILVLNNGPEIPPALKKRIFERGFTTKVGQNKGLGLALVKQCVSNLKGSIGLRSNRLTVFRVTVPIAKEWIVDDRHQSADR